MDIQAEAFSRWCKEAIERGLFEAHWREVGRYRDKVVLDPDFEKLNLLERMQMLAGFTARKDGRLAGYALFVITPPLHYKAHVFAVNDVVYVADEHRSGGTGLKLMKLAERDLTARGVSKIVYHFKLAQDQRRLMEHLGYEAAEVLYEKLVLP